jgi:hypothetical protein
MNQNLKLNVEKLQSLLPKFKASDAQFASNLIASFKKYGGLTPKQEPWVEKLIARVEVPAFQVLASYPAAVIQEPVHVGGFGGVIKLFAEAKAHLKFPKIRLQVEGRKVILALNGPKSLKAGHVSVLGEGTYPNRTFYGSVSPEGVFTPTYKTVNPFTQALTALLSELAENPARVAKDYGKLTGNCCFCGKDIGKGKEQRSVLVGFGPDCAEHYGLKGQWLAAAEKAEAKASVSPLGEWISAAKPAPLTETEVAVVVEAFGAASQQVPVSAPLKLEGPWIGSGGLPKPSVQDEVIESLVQAANEAGLAEQPKFTVFASYPSQADTVLAAEAQHEAAYEAKLKDESFWSAVGTSIEALGESAAQASDAQQAAKLEALNDYVVKPMAEVLLAAEAAQAAKLEVLSKSLLFNTTAVIPAIAALGEKAAHAEAATDSLVEQWQKVPVDAYQTGSIEWADTGGESVQPLPEINPDEQQAELGPDYLLACPEVKTCYLCEQSAVASKELHGYTVCESCIKELNA